MVQTTDDGQRCANRNSSLHQHINHDVHTIKKCSHNTNRNKCNSNSDFVKISKLHKCNKNELVVLPKHRDRSRYVRILNGLSLVLLTVTIAPFYFNGINCQGNVFFNFITL